MTVVNLSTFLAQLDALVSAFDDELAQVRREHQVKAAMQRYSEDKPLIESDDVTGDGGKYYVPSSALSAWDEGLSRIKSIEYPAATIASDEAPQYLGADDWDENYWADVSGTLTRHLYLPNHAPASTETMRILYTTSYQWSAGNVTTSVNQASHGFSANDFVYKNTSQMWVEVSNTLTNLATHQVTTVTDTDNIVVTDLSVDIPPGDFFAICNLAAGLVCQALAAKYSRTADSTLSLDSVDHTPRAQAFAARAKEFIGMYDEHLKLGEEGKTADTAAGTFVDWDTVPNRFRRWVFHNDG